MKVSKLSAYLISPEIYELDDYVVPKERPFNSEAKLKSEEFMEEVRKNSFHDKPSRITSLFVSPDWETTMRWRNVKKRFQPVTVYELELSGDLSVHISDYYDECYSFFDDSPYKIRTECKTKEEAAIKYWSKNVDFKANDTYLVEGIFVGKAKVIGRIELN